MSVITVLHLDRIPLPSAKIDDCEFCGNEPAIKNVTNDGGTFAVGVKCLAYCKESAPAEETEVGTEGPLTITEARALAGHIGRKVSDFNPSGDWDQFGKDGGR